ncbi:DUF4190 domain-containing protein [Streptomyces sp. NPDC002896]|uniref:DUF4190 domain-containing protein n=1 Tax=Streptomyces sp. NPDC002896 TaxID=3154438 RepID=UPI00332989AA
MDIPPSPRTGGPQQPPQSPYAPPGQSPYGAYEGGRPAAGDQPQPPYQPTPPYQPPPQPPYQPWPQPPYFAPVPPPAQPPVNGLAIAALVLGILCFLPAVGLVLGLVALGQIKRKGERGKGMAVAGMTLSSLGVVLLAVSLVTGAAGDFVDGFRDAAGEAGENGGTFSVDKGQCFDSPGDSLEGVAYDVDEVPCSGEHDGEVFAAFRMTGGTYPGDSRITEVADEKCYALRESYVMDTWAMPDDVDVYYFTPTRQSWQLGDREITCFFGSTDGGGTLKGSLRRDETTLDDDQVAYLKAANILDDAYASAPDEEYVEDDLPGHKRWAGRVSSALADESRGLRSHIWPAKAKSQVAALLRDIEAARKHWALAARAADADTFYKHYKAGDKLLGHEKVIAVRKALGLDTTLSNEGSGASGSAVGTEV